MSFSNILKFLAQFLVSAALLYWVFQSVDAAALLQLLSAISFSEVAFLLAITTVMVGLLQGLRWQRILLALGQQVGTAWAIHVSLLANFYNQVIPAMIGGELARVWQGRRIGVAVQTLILSVMVDRLIGLIAIAVMCAAGLAALFGMTGYSSIFMTEVTLVGLSLIGTIFVFSLSWMPQYFTRWRLFRGFVSLGNAVWKVARQRNISLSILLLSILSHSVQIAAIVFIARILDIQLGIGQALILCPPILFVSMMPISLAGWGVREGAMVVGLSFVGISTDSALAISILFGTMAIGIGALGGAAWIVYRALSSARESQG
jgi:glycosyltransferase 2 family protein